MIINHFPNFFYDNNLRMDPNIWGPKYWFVLHTIALSYPLKPNDVVKKKYYDFIQNLPLFIPVPEIDDDAPLEALPVAPEPPLPIVQV